MHQVLLVTQAKNEFKEFSQYLLEKGFIVLWADAGEEALSSVTENDIHLVVADEKFSDMTGLELVEKLVIKNPMIYCASVSSLPEEDYHEASEGLGILMQLPVKPKKKDAEALYHYYTRIVNLSKPST